MTNLKKLPKPTETSGPKLKSFINRNLTIIAIWLILVLSSIIILAMNIKNHGFSLLSGQSIFIYCIFAILVCTISYIIYLSHKRAWRIEKIYLICGLILGTFYVIFIPLGGTPDEPAHFLRAYELSEGNFFQKVEEDGTTGIYVPDNIQDIITVKYSKNEHGYVALLNNSNVRPSERYVLINGAADSYSIFNYIPQVFGILTGKLFQLPLVYMMLVSRFCNLVCCIFIIYFCIKKAPYFKKIIFLIAFFPMTMQLFASTSTDGSIICAGIALITYVLYANKTMKRLLNYKDLFILLSICLVLVVSKPIYAFLCPILFWMSQKRFRSRQKKIITILLLGLIVFLITLAKLFFSFPEARYDAGIQVNQIVTQPLNFSMILFKNIFLMPEPYIVSTIGDNLEWFNVTISAPFIITFFILFVLLCAERQTTITRSFKTFIFISFFTIVTLTFITMFIQWTAPGETVIDGVQGRYFLPILLLIPLFCLPSKITQKINIVQPYYLIVFTLLTNIYAIATIICHHL